jgi:hypothetical protein
LAGPNTQGQSAAQLHDSRRFTFKVQATGIPFWSLSSIVRRQAGVLAIAGIKDLLEAWDAGTNLPALLGVDVGSAALDETPLRLTRNQLFARLPGLTRPHCDGRGQPDS